MREHAVVGEPATCSHTRTRVPRERRIEGACVKVRSRAHARARARARIPRRRGCLLVLIYERTNTRVVTRVSHIENQSLAERRTRTQSDKRGGVRGAARSGVCERERREESLNISGVLARRVRVCRYEGV